MSALLCTEMLIGKKDGAIRKVNDRKSAWIWCEALVPERAEASTSSLAIFRWLG